MSVWDYIMPHRLLINKSLEKASQELRDRVEAYQYEFDRRLEECRRELQEAEDEKNQQIEMFKKDLVQKLGDEQKSLEEIEDCITQYIDCYYHRVYLKKQLEIKKIQNAIFREEYEFYNNQIVIVNNEILLLRERQNELSSFTKVDDIIQLVALNGYELGVLPTDDARQLLKKVSDALNTYTGDNRLEKNALIRLKTIIQERSDYLPTIKFITWVIRIKNQFKKQLSSKRINVKNAQAALRKEISYIKREIREVTDEIDLLAQKVRYYWAKPITYINADICYAYIELRKEKEILRKDAPDLRSERQDLIEKRKKTISEIRDKKSKRRDVGSELRGMKDSHSSDQWRWESLQREGSSLTSDINSLSDDIDRYSSKINSIGSEIESLASAVKSTEAMIASKKEARKKWEHEKNSILELFKRYDIHFRYGRRVDENDEITIVETRLGELKKIRENGIIDAQATYESEQEEITRAHEEKVSELKTRELELKTQLQRDEASFSKSLLRVDMAEKKLESAKNGDERLAFFKLFSESPDVAAAKEELEKARGKVIKENESKQKLIASIKDVENELTAENKKYNEEKEKCQPRYTRPTREEQQEEKILKSRYDSIKQRRKESGYENEN